jgi:hypothetical protein
VGFTTGSRGKVPGKTCEKRRRGNNNNNNNNNNNVLNVLVWRVGLAKFLNEECKIAKKQIWKLCTLN